MASSLLSNPAAATFMLSRVGHQAVQVVKDTGKPPIGADGKVKGEDTDDAVKKVSPGIMDGVAGAGVATSCLTMLWTQGFLVDIASVLTVIFSPFAAYQKRKLRVLGSFRENANLLRGHVNTLQVENNKLGASVDQLESSVGKLEEVEGELKALCNTDNVDRLQNIVKETGRIQAQIKQHLEAEVMQSILTTVMRADRNNDFHIEGREMKVLMMRMNNMPGVDFSEDVFRAHLRKVNHGKDDSVNLAVLMDIFRNLMDDSVPEEENIFHIKPTEAKGAQ